MKESKKSKTKNNYRTYRPEFCEEIVNFAKQGKNFTQFAESKGVTVATLCYWEKKDAKFKEARDRAKQCLAIYYEYFTLQAARGEIKCKPELVKLFAAKYAGLYSTPDVRIQIEHNQVAEDL